MSVETDRLLGHGSGRLPARVGARPRRDGRRVPGHGPAAEAAGGAEAGRAGAGGRSAFPGAVPARVASWPPRSTTRMSCRSTRPGRPTGSCGSRCATCRATTSRRCSSGRGRSSRRGRSSCRPGRGGARRRPRARARAPRRQAGERARHRGGRRGALLPDRLRAGAQPPSDEQVAAARPPLGHGRLHRARADRRTSRPTTAPTSTRSAACSTSAWPASRRSSGRGRSRPCSRTPASRRPPSTHARGPSCPRPSTR